MNMKKLLCAILLAFIIPSFMPQLVGVLAQSQQPTTDTADMNKTVNGKREGLWRIFSEKGGYEEGSYTSGRKDGVWVATYESGTTKSVITYRDGDAKGKVTFYYPNGNVMEEGFWAIDHWEGEYKYYYKNGTLSYHFKYNPQGIRQGEQLYYHDNGKILYSGIWLEGKVTGALSVYNANGVKIIERQYENGVLKNTVQLKPANSTTNGDALDEGEGAFKGTGDYTLYDLKGNVSKKGYFVKGQLHDGIEYIYNERGVQLGKKTYKKGELVK